jgi:recombinational DNA repair ATPase RecF
VKTLDLDALIASTSPAPGWRIERLGAHCARLWDHGHIELGVSLRQDATERVEALEKLSYAVETKRHLQRERWRAEHEKEWEEERAVGRELAEARERETELRVAAIGGRR